MSDPADRPTVPVDRWFDGHGIRIHGLDWGGPADGTPLLLLHGVGGNAWIWDAVAPRLRAALPDHRIVAIDQRDGGDTDHPATAYARADFEADVAAVHDQLGGAPMLLVGHSRGAWLGAAFTLAHPDRVARLVLVEPARLAFANAGDADRFYAWVEGAMGPFDTEADAVAWARTAEPEATWTDVRIRSFLFGLRRGPDGRLGPKLPRSAVPELRRAREGAADVTAGLGRLTTPSLLLVGDRQPAQRVADKVAYARVLPNVREVHLPGTHFLHTDLPDEVAHEISAFARA